MPGFFLLQVKRKMRSVKTQPKGG